uniref:Uncharacterized protein n=1 Tax=Octactis speculum TaxID=3111310 RepID=A0A6U3WK12_9STRA|mmetsp:Transcript_50975/g.69417  ORF Transcript_50975/g.69417 Transcript_50975/m.69417 type:complete len:143 (+) Transcript_50975:414-842(+)
MTDVMIVDVIVIVDVTAIPATVMIAVKIEGETGTTIVTAVSEGVVIAETLVTMTTEEAGTAETLVTMMTVTADEMTTIAVDTRTERSSLFSSLLLKLTTCMIMRVSFLFKDFIQANFFLSIERLGLHAESSDTSGKTLIQES